jgi:probable Rubsico expression protein CbbX
MATHHTPLTPAHAGGHKEKTMDAPIEPAANTIDLEALYKGSNVAQTIAALDNDLVGLVPVKTRIREIAALLLVETARRSLGMQAEPPSLHMCFTGNPGTGKTTVAQRMADILNQLGYIRRNHVVTVSRDDLVGQYIGHTAPKTKEVLKKAMGGVLFIDEAYYLYRPENERDYGQEAIEILLQVMEDRRDDLVVILAGYKDRMDIFFRSNPGMASRIAHHIDFPDYSDSELFEITDIMLGKMNYRLSEDARLHPAPHGPAPLFQRPLHTQRAGPRAAAPGQPPVRATRRTDRPRGPGNHHRPGYPAKPGIFAISPCAQTGPRCVTLNKTAPKPRI